jgi:hypothetical protein
MMNPSIHFIVLLVMISDFLIQNLLICQLLLLQIFNMKTFHWLKFPRVVGD